MRFLCLQQMADYAVQICCSLPKTTQKDVMASLTQNVLGHSFKPRQDFQEPCVLLIEGMSAGMIRLQSYINAQIFDRHAGITPEVVPVQTMKLGHTGTKHTSLGQGAHHIGPS